ncbi:hypothetical protein CYMTET_53240, partial [Cymbomonas tetramitiformis]
MLDARHNRRSDLALGYLNVKLGCCRDLRPTDPKLSGKCYVEFELKNSQQKTPISSSYNNLQNLSSPVHKNPKPVKARSTVHFGTDNPTWNESFFLKVHSRGQFLSVKLLDTVAETLTGFVEVNLDGFLDREDPVPILNAPFPLSKSPTELAVDSGTVELSIFFEPLKVSRLVLTVLDGFHLAASANVSLSGKVSVAGGHRKQKIRNVASGNGFPSWQETVHIDFDPREAVHHKVKIKLIESKASMYSPAVIGIAEIPMRDLMREQVEITEYDGSENKGFRKLQVLGARGKVCGQLSVSAFLRKSPKGFNMRGGSPTTPILTRSASLASDSQTMNTSFPSTSNSSPRDYQSSPFSPDSDDPGRISPAPENLDLPAPTSASSHLPIPGSEDNQRPSPAHKTPLIHRSPRRRRRAGPQRKAFTLLRFKMTFHDLQLTALKQERDFAKKFQLEYLNAITLAANIESRDVHVTGLPPPDSGPDKGCVIVETVVKLPQIAAAVADLEAQLRQPASPLLSKSELRQYHVSAELLQRTTLHEDEAGQVIEAPPAPPMVAGNGAGGAASSSAGAASPSQPAAQGTPYKTPQPRGTRVPLTSEQAQVLPQETRNGKPLWGPVEDMADVHSEEEAETSRPTNGGPQSAASHSTLNSMASATAAAHRAGAPGVTVASSAHHVRALSAATANAVRHTGSPGTAAAPHHTTAAAHHSGALGAAAAVHQSGAALGSAAGAQVLSVPAPATPSGVGELPALVTSAERPVQNGVRGPASHPLPSTPTMSMGAAGSPGLVKAATGPLDMRPGARPVTGAGRLSLRAAEGGPHPARSPSASSLSSTPSDGKRQPQMVPPPAPRTHHVNLMSPTSREMDDNCRMVFTIVFLKLKLFMLEDQ